MEEVKDIDYSIGLQFLRSQVGDTRGYAPQDAASLIGGVLFEKSYMLPPQLVDDHREALETATEGNAIERLEAFEKDLAVYFE